MKLTEHRTRWPKDPPRVYIGVDPGETTGVAIWKRNLPEEIRLYEVGPRKLIRLLRPYTQSRDAHFFTETFDIGAETVRKSPPHDSIHINGWIMLEATPLSYTEVGRADHKTSVSHALLRHLGWWVVGSDQHCRDAAKVLAFAMRRYREPWFLEKLESYADALNLAADHLEEKQSGTA